MINKIDKELSINKKRMGSFYSPEFLTKFIVQRLFSNSNIEINNNESLSILEPSAGDGSFVRAINNINDMKILLEVIEINKSELNKIKKIALLENIKANYYSTDFLFKKFNKKFDVILGNPPYIKREFISKEQKELTKEYLFEFNLKEDNLKNLWVSFLLKSVSLLNTKGLLAFILPQEFLQVKFAEKIRSVLIEIFERIEIFTIDELLFDCDGQKTVILFCYKKNTAPGIFYYNFKSKHDINKVRVIPKQNKLLLTKSIKWNHHFLKDAEIKLLDGLKGRLSKIKDHALVSAGIVTAANDFFIINEDLKNKYNLHNYTEKIIKKGLYVNGGVRFFNDDFEKLKQEGAPCYLLNFNSIKNKSKICAYLKIGERKNIHERYKCLERESWFKVPNISFEPEGFFFKRSHLYPKILKNDAKVFVTDSGYKINMKLGSNIQSLIFSFYNSLSLIYAELNGRSYGGGVLELTPNEFKDIPIPYINVDEIIFNRFAYDFKNKNNIESILETQDKFLLHSVLKLTYEEIESLQKIRTKLLKKRIAK